MDFTVQFNSIPSVVLRKSKWKAKDESRALLETDCDGKMGSEVEAAVSSRQLELRWRSSAFRAQLFWFVERTDLHARLSGDEDGLNCQRLCRQCCASRQARCLGRRFFYC